MRKTIIIGAAIAALALAGCGSDDDGGSSGGGYGSAAPKTTSSAPAETTPAAAAPAGAAKDAVTVDIAEFKFVPEAIAVKQGGSVTWKNEDSAAHTATRSSGAGMFDTDGLDQGQSKKITFSEPGTFAYICDFHPFMKGTVTVE